MSENKTKREIVFATLTVQVVKHHKKTVERKAHKMDTLAIGTTPEEVMYCIKNDTNPSMLKKRIEREYNLKPQDSFNIPKMQIHTRHGKTMREI